MSKTILLCTLGGSWAVVPEVYGFLAPDRLPLYRHHPRAEELSAARREKQLEVPAEIWMGSTRDNMLLEPLTIFSHGPVCCPSRQ